MEEKIIPNTNENWLKIDLKLYEYLVIKIHSSHGIILQMKYYFISRFSKLRKYESKRIIIFVANKFFLIFKFNLYV